MSHQLQINSDSQPLPASVVALWSPGHATSIHHSVQAGARTVMAASGMVWDHSWRPMAAKQRGGASLLTIPCYARRTSGLHELSNIIQNVVQTLTEASSDVIQAGSCSGSTQKGPPIRKPEPVWGHCCGTLGPAPGWNFTLLPFVCCAPRNTGACQSYVPVVERWNAILHLIITFDAFSALSGKPQPVWAAVQSVAWHSDRHACRSVCLPTVAEICDTLRPTRWK